MGSVTDIGARGRLCRYTGMECGALFRCLRGTRRSTMKRLLALSAALAVSPMSQAADLAAGKARAAAVCAACHGAEGVSVSDAIPHLAGQRAAYLEGQLKAFKEGTRKNPMMNAIAAQLGAGDIADVAAHFAGQPGAAAGAKSALLPNVARSNVAFPEGYRETFTKYHAINFPATRQVRYYYANRAAVQAAKAGKPLPDGSVLFAEVYAAKLDSDKKPVSGADGFYVAEKLLFYTAMASDAGWGAGIPEMLRNGNWHYTVFTLDKKQRPGVNQAECLACHKPLDAASYVFTLKELAAAK
jgi:cytochrome c553